MPGPIQDLQQLRQALASGHSQRSQLLEQALQASTERPARHAYLLSPQAELEQALSQPSQDVGLDKLPLAGMPVSVKDLFDVAGQRTLAGSVVLGGAAPAVADCPAVARLRAAGGLIAGRTNMTEFAFSGVGINPHYGTPVNPSDPQVERIHHVHHAGNSSGIVDGAAAVLIGTEAAGKTHGLTPRARIVSVALSGADPTIMLTGPMPAARKALAKAGLTIDQIDLFEVNEAFAVVPMALMADLKVPHEIVNVNGGACALGHPIGASGARILVTLIHALQARGKKRGLATLCIGGGEGTAMAIELV
jgi:flavin-binding protein dodecin